MRSTAAPDVQGVPARTESSWGGGRTGVFEISQFYQHFIGCDHVPQSTHEWIRIPEGNLAVATNGAVFTDGRGEFTRFRDALLAFYPRDVWLQKIAARCMTMAQSGQYNYARTLARGEYVAARMAEAEFIGAAVSMVFLLNRRYMPFYKWMHRALAGLPILGPEVHLLLAQLVHDDGLYRDRIQLVEIICSLVVGELRRQELSDAASGFLLDHGPCVQSKISDITIRSLGPWVDPSEH